MATKWDEHGWYDSDDYLKGMKRKIFPVWIIGGIAIVVMLLIDVINWLFTGQHIFLQ